MGLATYDDLKAAVADWLDREDLAGRTGDFITLAEARLNRLMGFSGLTARVTLEAGPGEAELAAPADLRDVLALVRTADGTAQGFRFEPGRLVLDPPPAAAVSLELTYRARPRLSEARPVNAVLAEHPRRVGTAHDGLDQVDDLVARIDVDAGVLVRERLLGGHGPRHYSGSGGFLRGRAGPVVAILHLLCPS